MMKKYNNIITTRILFSFFLFLTSFPLLFGQEIKIPFSKGKVIINGPGNLNIEGYDGNEVLVYEMLYELNRPDLMKGLNKLHSNRKRYNEVDIEYKIKGKVLTIDAIGRSGRYHLKVPKNLDISVQSEGMNYYYYDGAKTIYFENLNGEIEVYSKGGIDIYFKNTMGSISAVTYGNITASFAKLPKEGVFSFDTYLGYVNLELPEDANLNFSITAKKGAIFSNLPLNIKKKKKKNFKATLGKNGIDVIINTEAGGDVYLRKL